MSDETKVEETTNADDETSSQPIAKPNVVCSQNEINDAKKIVSNEPISSNDFKLFEDLLKMSSIKYENKKAIVIKQPSLQRCSEKLSKFLSIERSFKQFGNLEIKNGEVDETFLILDV